MSEIHITLKKVNHDNAHYEVRLDQSTAVACFFLKAEHYAEGFESEHFRHGVHQAVDWLKRLDPELHQEAVEMIFAKEFDES